MKKRSYFQATVWMLALELTPVNARRSSWVLEIPCGSLLRWCEIRYVHNFRSQASQWHNHVLKVSFVVLGLNSGILSVIEVIGCLIEWSVGLKKIWWEETTSFIGCYIIYDLIGTFRFSFLMPRRSESPSWCSFDFFSLLSETPFLTSIVHTQGDVLAAYANDLLRNPSLGSLATAS